MFGIGLRYPQSAKTDSESKEGLECRGLVELRRDDGVLDKKLEGNDLKRVFMSSFEDDRTRCSGLLNLQPTGSADAPAVTGF